MGVAKVLKLAVNHKTKFRNTDTLKKKSLTTAESKHGNYFVKLA